MSRHGRHWPKARDPKPSDDRAERQPRWISVVRDVITALMVVAIGLGVLYVLRVEGNQQRTDDRLQTLEADYEARVQQRNQQLQDLEALIRETNRQSVCDLLDGLPAGGFLDPRRTEYGCGPGIPLSELSPQQRQDLQNYRQGPLTTNNDPARDDGRASPNPRFSAGSASQPRETPPGTADAPTPTPTVAPPAVAPDDPSPPPLIDPNPVTDPVCFLLGMCL